LIGKGKAFPMKPLNEKIFNMIWGESSAALPGNSISGYYIKNHYTNNIISIKFIN
jgi:hypothetical protein